MNKHHIYVIIAGILSGFIVFGGAAFAKLGLSLYQIGFFPAFLATLILLPLVILKKEFRPNVSMMKLFAIFGLITFALVICEYTPIILGVPVAIIVLLIYTQPLWTVIFSKLFLKEKITRDKILALLLVILGVVTLINPFTIDKIGSILGVVLALLGGVLLSGWVMFGRVAGMKKINPITTKFGYTLFTLIFLVASYPLVRLLIKTDSISKLSFNLLPSVWIYLLLFAIFAQIIPHVAYFKGVIKVSASTAGIILLLEPISAAILAAIFLSQSLTWTMGVGGALILISNYLVVRKE